ncbi:MAG TPA: indolepyruvate ferredoxin oxidoreductase family protein, partial [Hellea balneolensis]|nr:indolepyruvate ferredoxin oxidoreductase family protein [Hellea balneolensis]
MITDTKYTLSDRYDREKGRVFLTGTQALVRIAFDQKKRDEKAGLNTAGFISGYRGSPLGSYDLELWKTKDRLAEQNIEFMPAVNEDLAATVILGSQQVETDPAKTVDGVFGIWYGKGPGVDRAGDALKHGNAYGSSPTGGALIIAGDDHGCVSSSMGHQSDVAFMTFFMPILNPASVEEYLSFGEYGFALSRYSGMWVGFKAVSETVEAAQSVTLPKPRKFKKPKYKIPATGLHYRWPDLPGPQIEERLAAKKRAVLAFAQANPIDKTLYDHEARFGIVTTGKGHLDTLEALRLLGLDEKACKKLGINIYKVGMVWPLEGIGATTFARGKKELFIVEEKRGIIESQFKEYFYDNPGAKPKLMVGKYDADGSPLLPWTGELSPVKIANALAHRLDANFKGHDFTARAQALHPHNTQKLPDFDTKRTPYFCSGCPHNTSTKVPQGSEALAGIGCHFMASWMDRETSSLIQMGGEGINWIARSRFNGDKHIFQNLGEGTYYHSGSMAIRQAQAAKINITYKILYNDAVAMTGGQPVDGPISVTAIAHGVRAEGVEHIVLVSDDPDKFSPAQFPSGIIIYHRDALDRVQREMREIKGVSVLIYEQTCASEKRKRRKRGQMPDPAKFVMINELVCEGCGDCGIASNCLSVEPLETEFGRKRTINQNSCNKDYSCIDGFCPSFVTIEGGQRRKGTRASVHGLEQKIADLTLPNLPALDGPYDMLVTGVGGTGVVTVGALITMAAHLENKGSSVLDFTGFAQKFGPVLSYVRVGKSPDDLHQVRIETARADMVLGCDLVVSSSEQASKTYCKDHTQAVINTTHMPTGAFTRDADLDLQSSARLAHMKTALGENTPTLLDANKLSEILMGNSVYANVMLMGLAWQKGLIPVGLDAMIRAIDLNGVAPAANKRAFHIGRLAAADPGFAESYLGKKVVVPSTLDETIATRSAFLTQYQNKKYAHTYETALTPIRARETELGLGENLSQAAAKALFKVMSYKDEYEVARLHRDKTFKARIAQEFEGDYAVKYHLAPPIMNTQLDGRGRPKKKEFGASMGKIFAVLARLKFLRGSAFDIFGYSAERKSERALIVWVEDMLENITAYLNTQNHGEAVNIVENILKIRGYGPVKDENLARIKPQIERQLARYI